MMYDQMGADLIITDIVMPTMDGIEVIRHLVAKNVTPKIIAVSGQGGNYLESAKEFGADATLTKPFRIADVLETVEKLLASDSDHH